MAWRHLPLQWAVTLGVAALSTLVFFWVARQFGPDRLGIYSYLLSGVALITLVLGGSFRQLIFRERIGAGASRAVTGHALGHALILAALALVAAGLVAGSERGLWWGGIAVALGNTLAMFLAADLKASGHFDREARWQLLSRGVPALALAASVFIWPTPLAAIWVSALTLGWVLWTRRDWFRANPIRFGFRLALYRSVLALLIIDIATVVYFRVDLLLMQSLGVPLAEIGRYAAASKVLEGLILLAQPLSQIFFRQVRLAWIANTGVLKQIAWLAGLMLLAAAGSGALMLWLGGPLLVWMLGDAYQGITRILPWLMLALLFIFPNAILTQASIALNQERWYAGLAVVAALVNIALNLLLIPSHGIIGAAWATVATEATLSLGLLWNLARLRRVSAPADGADSATRAAAPPATAIANTKEDQPAGSDIDPTTGPSKPVAHELIAPSDHKVIS